MVQPPSYAPPPAGFPPPQQAYAPPPQQQYAPPQQQYVPPPQPQYAPPPQADYGQSPYGAPGAGAAAPAFGGGGGGGSGAEVEVMDGTRAMEVQTVYRDVVIGTRHLYNPTGKSTHGQGTAMVYAGAGLAALALITFVATAVDVGHDHPQRPGVAHPTTGSATGRATQASPMRNLSVRSFITTLPVDVWRWVSKTSSRLTRTCPVGRPAGR